MVSKSSTRVVVGGSPHGGILAQTMFALAALGVPVSDMSATKARPARIELTPEEIRAKRLLKETIDAHNAAVDFARQQRAARRAEKRGQK